MHGLVERVGLLPAEIEDRVETAEDVVNDSVREPGPDDERLARPDGRPVMGRGLGPNSFRVHAVGSATYDRLVKRILDEGCSIGHAEEPLEVRLVLGEEKRRGLRLKANRPPPLAQVLVHYPDR